MITNYLWVSLLSVAVLRWGAAPERICVATLFAVTFGDPIYHLLVQRAPVYGSVDIGHLVIDVGVALVFVGVALRANRVYPLWLAAFQLVSVLSHFAREVTDSFPKLAYGMMSYGPFYIILAIMTGGLVFHARRRKHLGPYRSWRTFSSPSPGGGREPRPIG
ncbi:hypothetical protein SAMN05428974_0495 [Sphingopyxis sp. YR583]|uniref:hypothetical protein n=1 Tax=Sphingopyxis sp. YR583 TaxID=1881047 RepID=UPI0008A7CF85|nr:hypothetical protein [Sphingopyxis sp. YR583]SEH12533.1 hypothetical protein SAMN05428974_0495 [Sphingopyxis sp. YR583]